MFLSKKFLFVLGFIALVSVTACNDGGGDGGNGSTEPSSTGAMVFGNWNDGSKDFTVRKSFWDKDSIEFGGDDLVKKKDKGFVVTKSGTDYYRIDWLLKKQDSSEEIDLYWCKNTNKATDVNGAKALAQAKASDLAAGCNSGQWSEAKPSLEIFGMWSEGDFLEQKGMMVTSQKYGSDNIDSYDNKEGFLYVSKSGKFDRYNWKVTDSSHVYVCKFPLALSTGDLSKNKDFDKIDRDNLDSGCNGNPWDLMRPTFPFAKRGWKSNSGALVTSYKRYDEKPVVYFDPYEKNRTMGGFVTNTTGSYSYFKYVGSGSKWTVCPVSSGKASIEDALSVDVDASSFNNCSNASGKVSLEFQDPFNGDITPKSPSVKSWYAAKVEFPFDLVYPSSTSAGQWLYGLDVVSQGISQGLSYLYTKNGKEYGLTFWEEDKSAGILYTCDAASGDSLEDVYNAVDNVTVKDNKTNGCMGKAWSVNYSSSKVPLKDALGFYKDTQTTPEEYTVGMFKVVIGTKTYDVEQADSGTDHAYLKGADGKFSYVVFKDNGGKRYVCHTKEDADKSAIEDIVNATSPKKIDDTNMTSGCDSKAWVELKSENGYEADWDQSSDKAYIHSNYIESKTLGTLQIKNIDQSKYTVYAASDALAGALKSTGYGVLFMRLDSSDNKKLYVCPMSMGKSSLKDAESASSTGFDPNRTPNAGCPNGQSGKWYTFTKN